MPIKNKDLNLILESFLKTTRHHSEEAPGMAFVMTSEGKITQLSGHSNHADLSAAEVSRYFESGIAALVRAGKCKAIGLPLESGIFLEHQDRSAYLVQLSSGSDAPVWSSLTGLAPIPAQPRFFLKPRLR